MSESVWGAKVGEKSQELEQSLRELSGPGPKGVPVSSVRCGICLQVSKEISHLSFQSCQSFARQDYLLRMDEPGELDRIANEEPEHWVSSDLSEPSHR